MSEQSFGNAREKTILNDYRWPHPKTAAPLEGAKYPATLQWEIGNTGKIILKVNDGVFNQGDNNGYKNKQQELTLVERNAIFELLKTAATTPTFERSQYFIKRRRPVKEGGQFKLSTHPILEATFTVMRDPSGLIKLGFTKANFKALFVFDRIDESELTEFINGEYVPAVGLMSRIYVLAYVESIGKYLNDKEFAKYTPKEPKQKSGGNGGGYNNRSQNNGGSYGNNTPDFDDDISF